MTKRVIMLIISLLFLPVSALGDESPQVLQPNTTGYSATQLAAVSRAITDIEETLEDYHLGSKRYFGPEEWLSQDFAAYTAGTLAELGYEARLVRQGDWPDGMHVWVLVGIHLGVGTAWIPVESSPEAGHNQQTLGYIPSYTDSGGNLWFEARYVSFSEVVELPPNLSPVAKFRLPPWAGEVNESVKFTALGSYDPDGEIVIYHWDFGDGKTWISSSRVCRHGFNRQGFYTITLTVVDNQGKGDTTSDTLRVLSGEESETGPSSSGGCGCGR
jgi:hypothetical protein